MTNVASKNPYDLLGNDPELDPEREPEPPTKIIDKPVARTGKRNAGAEGLTSETPRGGGRGRGGRDYTSTRGEQAGSFNDRAEKRDDGLRQDRHSDRTRGPREHRGGRGRGDRGARGEGGERGGRGYSGRFQRTNRDDRSDHTGIGSHEKQAAQGWGDEKSGTAEWNDEKAGDEIARAESKDEPGFTPDTSAGDPAFTNGPGAPGEIVDENAAPEEPEEKTKSYDEYLAEQAEKRLALGGESLQVRKANEGSKQKFPEGTVASREQEDFFKGAGGKAKREKANQQSKQTLQLDGQYYASGDSAERGGTRGRGRGRGGPRGEFRGDRGGEGRGRGGRGRGEFRGERGDRGGRGGYRGDRGDGGDRGSTRGSFNATDQSAFPSLGSA